MINRENSKILLENEMLEEVRIQGKGSCSYPITPRKGYGSCNIIFPEGVETVRRELRVCKHTNMHCVCTYDFEKQS